MYTQYFGVINLFSADKNVKRFKAVNTFIEKCGRFN